MPACLPASGDGLGPGIPARESLTSPRGRGKLGATATGPSAPIGETPQRVPSRKPEVPAKVTLAVTEGDSDCHLWAPQDFPQLYLHPPAHRASARIDPAPESHPQLGVS